MEESLIISTFCKTLTCFCKHIENSSEALKESVQRRPIPLDSASSTFIQCLNRRVSSASSDLNLLESMAFGTVSFEELLGHCNELYKKNQTDLIELEDRFMNFGYIPTAEIDDEDSISGLIMTPIGMESKLFRSEDKLDLFSSISCEPRSIMKRLEEDPLFDESLSLQNLGFSDVCLATLASEVKTEIASTDMMALQKPINFDDRELHGARMPYQPSAEVLGKTRGELRDNPISDGGATATVINVSKNDYDNLPSFMKTLSSWEDLSAAVEKMNANLGKQEKPKDSNRFHPDELLNLDLGPKVRSYLLLLLRMNRLVVETVDGSIVYRVL